MLLARFSATKHVTFAIFSVIRELFAFKVHCCFIPGQVHPNGGKAQAKFPCRI
jgi:hypothetical protein